MIRHQYIGEETKQIYLTSYVVDEENPNVLIIPPLAWYSIGPNRMFSNLAGKLNEKGLNAYIFDYYGQGESSMSCFDVTVKGLEEAVDTVFTFVKKKGQDIYCLGYGIGNTLIQKLEQEDAVKGIIYYLPQLEKRMSAQEVFTEKEWAEAEKKGYFSIQLERGAKYEFWKGIIGGYCDIIYNPVNISFVKAWEEADIVSSLETAHKPVYVIADKELAISNENVQLHYIKEYEENVLPWDWAENVWPGLLQQVNDDIVQWIMEYTTCGSSDRELDQIIESNQLGIMKNSRSIRILESYESNGENCLATLHLPKSMDGKVPCVMFVTGLGGDKLESHMTGPRMGDFFSERGFATFRYDSRFSGTSVTCLSKCTISELIEDYHAAATYLRKYEDVIDFNRVFVIGWSEGAKIALSQPEGMNIRANCFWNPVLVENEIEGQEDAAHNGIRSFVRLKNSKTRVKSISNAGEWFSFDYVKDNYSKDYVKQIEECKTPIMNVWSEHDITNNNYKMLQAFHFDEFIVNTPRHLFAYDIMEDIFQHTYDWFHTNL